MAVSGAGGGSAASSSASRSAPSKSGGASSSGASKSSATKSSGSSSSGKSSSPSPQGIKASSDAKISDAKSSLNTSAAPNAGSATNTANGVDTTSRTATESSQRADETRATESREADAQRAQAQAEVKADKFENAGARSTTSETAQNVAAKQAAPAGQVCEVSPEVAKNIQSARVNGTDAARADVQKSESGTAAKADAQKNQAGPMGNVAKNETTVDSKGNVVKGDGTPAATANTGDKTVSRADATNLSQSDAAKQVEVKSGDTLSGIAAREGASLNSVKEANPALQRGENNYNLIFPGDKVNIPGQASSAPSADVAKADAARASATNAPTTAAPNNDAAAKAAAADPASVTAAPSDGSAASAAAADPNSNFLTSDGATGNVTAQPNNDAAAGAAAADPSAVAAAPSDGSAASAAAADPNSNQNVAQTDADAAAKAHAEYQTPDGYSKEPSPSDLAAGGKLEKGMAGPSVKAMQETLIKAGANIEADGKFGPKTQAAVRDYQAGRNLKVDGIAGKNTNAALQKTAALPAEKARAETAAVSQAKGTTSPADVQSLKDRLPGPLKQYAETFVAAGKKYGVDPRFLAAVSMHETAKGTSSAFRNKNNAMGVSDRRGPIAFSRVEDSITKMARSLTRPGGYYDGKNTIGRIANTYAPVGAANDPGGLNNYWGKGVAGYMKQLGISNPYAFVVK